MIHLNIICAQCGDTFTYESQRTKPRPYCTERCRNVAKYWADPESVRAQVREYAAKHKKSAPVIKHETICEHCGVAFCHQNKRQKPNRFCSSACIKAAHYMADKEPYLARARAQKEDPEYLAKQRAYYAANKDKLAETAKAWRERNAEKISVNKAEYYRRNRDARLAYWHEWANDPGNRLRTRENVRRWAQENPEKVRTYEAARRALKRAVTVESFDPHEIFERDGWFCQLCGEPVDPSLRFPHVLSRSLDHIIPLSRGGDHSRANTQLAHFGCNSSKNNKMPDELAAA